MKWFRFQLQVSTYRRLLPLLRILSGSFAWHLPRCFRTPGDSWRFFWVSWTPSLAKDSQGFFMILALKKCWRWRFFGILFAMKSPQKSSDIPFRHFYRFYRQRFLQLWLGFLSELKCVQRLLPNANSEKKKSLDSPALRIFWDSFRILRRQLIIQFFSYLFVCWRNFFWNNWQFVNESICSTIKWKDRSNNRDCANQSAHAESNALLINGDVMKVIQLWIVSAQESFEKILAGSCGGMPKYAQKRERERERKREREKEKKNAKNIIQIIQNTKQQQQNQRE